MVRFVRLSPFALVFLLMRSLAAEADMCAIDMGSNSVRRIVGSFANGRYAQRSMEVHTLSVGDDVTRYGRITAAMLAEIERTLTAFKNACDKDGAAPIVAVGTAAYRQASNGRRVAEIAGKVGISMEIATERRESELAYLVGSLGQDGVAVIDNGSRSIELTSKDSALRYRVVDLGYRVAYERFFANARDASAAVEAFRRELERVASAAPFMKGKKTLVGIELGEMAAAVLEIAGHRRARDRARRAETEARRDSVNDPGSVRGLQEEEGHRPRAPTPRRRVDVGRSVRLFGDRPDRSRARDRADHRSGNETALNPEPVRLMKCISDTP
jgi:hypothetical protein